MRRPPKAFALVVVLGACFNAPSSPGVPGGKGGSAAAPSPDEIGKLHPPGFETGEVGPLEAPEPEADHVEHEPSDGNGSGFSRGAGRLGPRIARPPDVIPGSASVQGSLDKEIVRRIVRRHINEVKYCYELELVRKRAFGGWATFEFTISLRGAVVAARLRDSTLRAPRVESCVVAAIRRWEFPHWELPHPLGREVVNVSYPFHFVPGSAGYTRTAPAKPAGGVDDL
jgi:hypothetical protein